jgi:DNA-directed RNA polymerase subunit RPC12/RpoP
MAEEDPKKKKVEEEVKQEVKAPEHPIGEELDVIHVWCKESITHMTNIAYNEQGASMFQCPRCGLKIVVAKVE